MSPNNSYQEQEFEYHIDTDRMNEPPQRLKRNKRPNYSRNANRVQSFNGIHRRRAKKWAW